MENNERKNNRSVFYAIMGVATLVITLIGATFAYFVATTNSAANAITTGSTTVSLTFDDNTVVNYSSGSGNKWFDVTSGNDKALHIVTNGDMVSGKPVELLTGIRDSLIPVDTICTAEEATIQDPKRVCTEGAGKTLTVFAKGGYSFVDKDDLDNDSNTNESIDYEYAGANEFDCRDANGNSICSVYSFTVTNPANVSQTIYPSFKVKSNGFETLKYAVFKGTPAQIAATKTSGAGWDVNGTVVSTTTTMFGSQVTNLGAQSFTKTVSSTAVRKQVRANPGDLVISASKVGAPNSVETWLDSQVSGGYNRWTGSTMSTDSWTTSDKSAIAANWERLVQILDPNESLTYTMIFWIEETYDNQSDKDMTKNFEAQVLFTTEGNGTGVTGSLIMR